MEIIQINSLDGYVKAICDLKGKTISLMNEVLLFRGQSDKEKELLPYLGRRNKDNKQLLQQERNYIELAKLKMPDIFKNDFLPLELLALLQHYGIPTRLMDVTENALVALYFACSSERNMDKDGEVFVFKHFEDDVTNYPIYQAIADSYRLVRGDNYSLEFFYIGATNQPYFSEQKIVYDLVFKNSKENQIMTMEKIVSGVCSKPIFVYATIRTLRQRTQSGRYILFPNCIKKNSRLGEKQFIKKITPLSKNHKCIKARLLISCSAKRKIVSELRSFGITQESLYCDNIDSICGDIKKYVEMKE